jgi:hypothetical protein
MHWTSSSRSLAICRLAAATVRFQFGAVMSRDPLMPEILHDV